MLDGVGVYDTIKKGLLEEFISHEVGTKLVKHWVPVKLWYGNIKQLSCESLQYYSLNTLVAAELEETPEAAIPQKYFAKARILWSSVNNMTKFRGSLP
jgi:hypothetical protein